MENKKYVVIEWGGEYEESYDRICGVFSTREKAKEFIDECLQYDKIMKDPKSAPMTEEEYAELNYGYDEDEETIVEKNGYTVDDFMEMHERDEYKYHNKGGYRIETYIEDDITQTFKDEWFSVSDNDEEEE